MVIVASGKSYDHKIMCACTIVLYYAAIFFIAAKCCAVQLAAPHYPHHMQRCNHCRAANPQHDDFFPNLIQKPREFEDAIIHVPQQLNEFGCPNPCLAMRPLFLHVIRHVHHDVGRFQNGISFQYGFCAIWLNEC